MLYVANAYKTAPAKPKIGEAPIAHKSRYIPINWRISKLTGLGNKFVKKLETAVKEGYFEEIKADYEDMISKVTPSKERDLMKFKAEISEILENEIISRYFFQKGRTVASLKNDIVVQRALEVLTNVTEYNTILKKIKSISFKVVFSLVPNLQECQYRCS